MTLYLLFLIIHIFSAMFWIGGTLFYVFIIFKVLTKEDMKPFKSLVIKESALQFRNISYVIFMTLFLSGLGLIFKKHNWSDLIHGLISVKLVLFILLLISSIYHDFVTGPKTFLFSETDLIKYNQYRKISSYFGRINLLISISIAILGVLISRGIK
ncbi:MAG TPA: hypothetical protein PK079_21545 [Leptospiraceae bacterium]|nr:hypothetical protein [Leptospiraceae bacterium]HMW08403.1 hypothetical protein [Leptospiraceae bacterium]HMX33685.1 hypothetical protein [Leptospiraceae bacterium]HMY34100.1 hypothetical protein [Leptospiraceae bacterium]HMZ65964.1 hypothetical protein [Leptospiraceae bacterium]